LRPRQISRFAENLLEHRAIPAGAATEPAPATRAIVERSQRLGGAICDFGGWCRAIEQLQQRDRGVP
jgi:hypothetical protein